MIEEPPLLTIRSNQPRPSAEQVRAVTGVPTGMIADALGGGGAMHCDIQLLDGVAADQLPICGPALTADCGPGDILATLAALKYIQTGDIVVSAFHGHRGCASAGDRVVGMIKNNGAAAFITDGPVRDVEGILECGLPVWCNGSNPASPFAKGPGSVGFAVQAGGREVNTGDIIVADRDGVVVIPFGRIAEVVEKIATIVKLEEELDSNVKAGLKVPENIEALLASDQVEIIE